MPLPYIKPYRLPTQTVVYKPSRWEPDTSAYTGEILEPAGAKKQFSEKVKEKYIPKYKNSERYENLQDRFTDLQYDFKTWADRDKSFLYDYFEEYKRDFRNRETMFSQMRVERERKKQMEVKAKNINLELEKIKTEKAIRLFEFKKSLGLFNKTIDDLPEDLRQKVIYWVTKLDAYYDDKIRTLTE